jgi:phosphatidate phosphatase LPIN
MYARPDPPAGATTIEDEHVEELVNDLMASASPKTDKDELSASIAALALEDKMRPTTPSPKKGRAFERAQTEPPEEHTTSMSRPLSPTGERIENPAEMDLAWDWSQLPKDKEDKEANADGSPVVERPPAPQRGESLPVALDGVVQATPLATLKPIDDDDFTYMLQCDNRVHMFELSLCGDEGYAPEGKATQHERDLFEESRVSFSKFVEDAAIVDDPKLIVKYKGLYLSWKTGYHVLFALAIYRRSMTPPKAKPEAPQRQSGYWSRWWRRTESTGNAIERVQSASGVEVPPKEKPPVPPTAATSPPSEVPSPTGTPALGSAPGTPPAPEPAAEEKHYAKTLRLSSDQLKELHLKPGPNTIQFSVTSSYSGNAVVTARIFLWEDTDQVIISDIDGTITKSDALGHVFAAIGRDWTHVGIANLYTDITNNGYKIIYLTARAIGQADTTREYLKTIVQGDYRMPEGPVIMSPDRLMASLHREVILRKPELFKMACLRDIQRLFGKHAKSAFFAGFGNRITDAMSYRSVGIGTGKIYTIDSTGVILTELLQTSHRGSYVGLNDLVNEVFPPVKTKFQPQYTDFNYWKAPIMDIPLPDFTPPSPALSARSDASGASRLSVLGRIATLGRRGSRSPPPDAQSQTSRPTSPLLGPSITADDLEDDEDEDEAELQQWGNTPAMTAARRRRDSGSSMPGSFENGNAFPEEWDQESQGSHASKDHAECEREHENYEEEDEMFDDDILATGEMANVPF